MFDASDRARSPALRSGRRVRRCPRLAWRVLALALYAAAVTVFVVSALRHGQAGR